MMYHPTALSDSTLWTAMDSRDPNRTAEKPLSGPPDTEAKTIEKNNAEGSSAPSGVRRSDRIPITLNIQVSGSDGFGNFFMEDTQTVVVSRYGAKILLNRALVPEQEIMVRCLKTALESDARVVGQVGKSPTGFFYGIEFLNQDINVWDIEFPQLSDSDKAVARVLLECGRCHTQELVYLNELEAEVFGSNKSISRPCKRCNDSSLWKQAISVASTTAFPDLAQASAASKSPPVPPPRTQNERKDVRVNLKMVACIRGMQCGEEVVTTENISRGGLRFKSAKFYAPGSTVEVAVPFAHGASNIFALARISHAEYMSSEGLTLYGIEYIKKNPHCPT